MNYRRRVLQFNLIFLLCLIIISLVFPKISALTATGLRSPSIFSEVERDTSAKAGHITRKKHSGNGPDEKTVLKDYISDSGLINAGGHQYAISSFIEKLAILKKDKTKKVRIAWFGDSFIEGDLITKDLRERLQNEFGGSGVGFVPVTSVTAGFRQTITHGFSDNWDDINFHSDDKGAENLFLSGHSFYPQGTASVNYRSVKHALLDSFTNMSVLYGAKGNEGSMNLTVNGQLFALKPEGSFKSMSLPVNSKTVSVSVSSSNMPLYGFSFEGSGGIVLDNFSFRGISGVELGNFKDDFMKQINKEHPYDLIVLQYGPNLLYKAETTDFSWYTKKMQPVLNKLHADFPETDFLLISTADKSFRYGGQWETQKGVEPLIDAQYQMASAAQMDFFNLYHAMGGNGQMINWVNAKPSLANKDYTHVNSRGATTIADYLFTAIIHEYNAYQKSHP